MVLQDTNSETFFTLDKIICKTNNKKNKFSKIRFICDFDIIVDYFDPITTITKNIVMRSFIKKRRILKFSISSNDGYSFISNNNLRVPKPICNNIHLMFKKYSYSTSASIINIYSITK